MNSESDNYEVIYRVDDDEYKVYCETYRNLISTVSKDITKTS